MLPTIAQKFEPKWVGEVCILNIENGDTTLSPTEKANVQVKTTQSAGRILVGIGNIRQKVTIKGGKSPIQLKYDQPVTLVVRCKDNENDPNTFIRIVKFEEKSKERKTELAKQNWIGNTSEGNMTLIPYSADKYGKSCYILTVDPQEGEFGVSVTNPNDMDEKIPVFFCYGTHNERRVQGGEDTITDYTYTQDNISYPIYKSSNGRLYIPVG